MSRAREVLRSPSLVLAILVMLVALPVFGADLGTRPYQFALCWAMLAASHIGLLVISGLVARGAPTRSGRWVWGGIAAAGLFYAVGDIVQLGLLARGPGDLATSLGGPVQSILVLVGTAVPIGAVVLLTPLAGHRPRRPRARLALDVAIVMIAATVFGAYLALPGTGATPAVVWLGLLIGPGLFLAVALGTIAISRSSNPPMSRHVAALVVVAAIVEAGAQAGTSVLARTGHLSWHLLLTALASAALLAAAGLELTAVRSVGARRVGSMRPVVALVPYVALLATFALLLRVLLTQMSGVRHWSVVVGALLSALLVVFRQVVVNADNSRLVEDLDAKVEQLNQLLGERDRLAVALRHAATHDPLTGLANRALLGTSLDAALARLAERPGRITLMLIDLDEFKSVNDRFGHAAGDSVLRAVGGRIRGCVRELDVVARLGGDEFALLVEDMAEDDQDLARRIADALREPIALTDGAAGAAASIGVITTSDPSRSAESLLHAADVAMYRAKRANARWAGLQADDPLAGDGLTVDRGSSVLSE